ncbi:LOW QUALITY PROTEIN: SLAM family member 9-like [Anomaloglossus baeobatrachus]|uniref:LOW QUALITY PROTEIN: SLAM family member 9-like n=1 Tax=Anomaloglossus baeobatrachus TaxID=238106 RepID=UPI003F5032A5
MLLWFLLLFLVQPCVICSRSGTLENVSGAEGGEVVLGVHQTGIRTINWILLLEGNLIVTTKPGRSIEDDDVLSQYRGRVRSEADGSLHINNLSAQDQRIYKIDIRTNEDESICVLFNLTLYEKLSLGDMKISPSFTRNDSCSLGLLCTVDRRDVTITWSHLQGNHINVTQGDLYVPPSDVNATYICTARNPISNISKIVIPGKYCKTETSKTSGVKRNPLCLILSGIVLLMSCCIITYHIKSEVIQPTHGNRRQRQHKVAQ